MIIVPKESQCRGCVHYKGVEQPDGTEATERIVCAAFPEGIPDEILGNQFDHSEPYPGDGGVTRVPIEEDNHITKAFDAIADKQPEP